MNFSSLSTAVPKDASSFSREELLLKLLKKRGFQSLEDAESFLNPDYEKGLHDPFLLPDMEKAVSRMLSAIEKKEKIVAFTDYDTDGTPAAVIFYDFFKEIEYENFDNYIPHRQNEGYGLNMDAIEEFGKNGVTLLITADCGITDIKEVARAHELGIDVIITDHHLPLRDVSGEAGDQLPPAYAVINPKRADNKYPFDGLCGAAVAFKFLTALIARGTERKLFSIKPGSEKWMLDMVGLATIADMVPLRDENRVLAHYGLRVLRKSRRLGIRSLLAMLKVRQEYLTEEDVGFSIGPRINAASRMDNPIKAFHLLATRDNTFAQTLAGELEELNKKRKIQVLNIVREAKRRLSLQAPQGVVVLGNLEWNPGVLGLAANSLVEEFDRPAFVWGSSDGKIIKGSCRGDGRVNVVELMREAPDAFIDFGGHEHSGGFSLSRGSLHTFEEKLLSAMTRVVKKESASRRIGNTNDYDAKLFLSDISWNMYSVLEQLSPFGVGNHKPVFLFEGVTLVKISFFGADKNHLRITVTDALGDKKEAIQFFPTARDREFVNSLGLDSLVNLYAHVEKSTFRNFPELRLRIVNFSRAE